MFGKAVSCTVSFLTSFTGYQMSGQGYFIENTSLSYRPQSISQSKELKVLRKTSNEAKVELKVIIL